MLFRSVNVVWDNTDADHYVPFVYSSGNKPLEIDSGLRYNPGTNTLTGTISTANNANQVNITFDSTTNSDHYVPFVYSSGNRPLEIASGIRYNPSTNTLTGTISTATNANQVNITFDSTTNSDHYVPFVYSSGNRPLEIDSGLRYNPSTNTLSGAAVTAVQVNTVWDSSTDYDHYVPFVYNTGNRSLEIDSGIRYNPSTNTLTGTISTANHASQVNVVVDSSQNADHYVPFVYGSGNRTLEIDGNGLRYNPSTNTLTGTISTATNLADGANITTGTINVARLGSGASGTKFLRGDNTWQTVSGGGGGISDVVDDTSPQLGGNLDLNSKYITGTGGINVTGVITATTFYGDGSNLTNAGASAAKSAAIASFLGR